MFIHFIVLRSLCYVQMVILNVVEFFTQTNIILKMNLLGWFLSPYSWFCLILFQSKIYQWSNNQRLKYQQSWILMSVRFFDDQQLESYIWLSGWSSFRWLLIHSIFSLWPHVRHRLRCNQWYKCLHWLKKSYLMRYRPPVLLLESASLRQLKYNCNYLCEENSWFLRCL